MEVIHSTLCLCGRNNGEIALMKSRNQQGQISKLKNIILQNPAIKTVFDRMPDVHLPNWYLGAGCLAQTVWNYYSDRELQDNISDLDLVYFDDTDLGFEAEDQIIKLIQDLFSDLDVHMDVKNQARVHLWYEKHFGYPIKAYQSVEEAIDTWPTTATSTGVKFDGNGKFWVYAPFGLDDLLGMTVRANKTQITEDVYLKKVERWKACWPDLEIIPW